MVDKESGKPVKKYLSGLKINPPVFWISAIIIIGSMTVQILLGKKIVPYISLLRLWVCQYTGWFFILVVNVILFYIIFLFFSKYSKLKLGGRASQPDRKSVV